MPDSFFASNKTRKRKRAFSANEPGSAKKILKKGFQGTRESTSAVGGGKVNGILGTKRKKTDEELDSEKTDEEDGGIDDLDLRADVEPEDSGDEDIDETPAEKRLRLAKIYLENVKDGLAEGEFDAAEIDKELISARLRQDVLEHSGKVHLFLADMFDFSEPPTTLFRCKGHRLSVTSAIVSEDARWLFTSGKEGSINKWDLRSGRKVATFHKQRAEKGKGKEKAAVHDILGHTDEILTLALSSDGKYLASGGKDRKVGIWDVEKEVWVKGFGGHKDFISALSFRKGSQQLYSGSFDRTVKLFDLSVMGYVETLFGHQDTIVSVDALRGETVVTAGARDRTVRFWKIADETQLVFRGGGGSAVRELLEGGALEGIDEVEVEQANVAKEKGQENLKEKRYVEGSLECVAMIDETTFVSGGDTGSICLWSTQKKKPIFTQALCHGFHETQSSTEGLLQTPRWITAIACLRYADLFASGSWEGVIRIWKLHPTLKSFSLIGTIPAPGVVNSLQLLSFSKGALADAPWATPQAKSSSNTSNGDISSAMDITGLPTKKSGGPAHSVLLVAALGQEYRFGRWLCLKGEANTTLTVFLHPRTL